MVTKNVDTAAFAMNAVGPASSVYGFKQVGGGDQHASAETTALRWCDSACTRRNPALAPRGRRRLMHGHMLPVAQ